MATKQAEEWKLKGNEEFKKGNHGKAIEFYTYATELDPKNPVFFTNRSNAYFLMKNYDKSLRDADKSIKADPNWSKGHYRRGLVLMETKDYKSALAAFQSASDLDPKNAAFANEVARAKAAMMEGMSAVQIIKEEGNAAFKSGQIEEAVKIYTRAIAACKNTEVDLAAKKDCLSNRAACYRQLYHPEECIADCTQVLEMEPQHVKALVRRGQAYESMEKYKEALDDFQLAARISPSLEVAFKGASRLRSAMRNGSGKN